MIKNNIFANVLAVRIILSYRQTLGIKWSDKVRNEDVLQPVVEDRQHMAHMNR